MNHITTQQAAEIIGVHPRTVKQAAARHGVEPAGKVGGAWAWDRAQIEHVASVYTRQKTGKVNRKFTLEEETMVDSQTVARRLAAAKRRRTGADGVRVRAYQKMVSDAVSDEFRPVSPCVVVKMAVRAEVRYRGLT